MKVDGTPYKSMNKCKNCGGEGKLYVETDAIAGFKYKPYLIKTPAMVDLKQISSL